jgi:hypothetical protein
MQDPIKRKKLYDALLQEELITESFESFESGYADKNKREALHKHLVDLELVTESFDEFNSGYFADLDSKNPQTQEATQSLKKKEETQINLESPSSSDIGNSSSESSVEIPEYQKEVPTLLQPKAVHNDGVGLGSQAISTQQAESFQPYIDNRFTHDVSDSYNVKSELTKLNASEISKHDVELVNRKLTNPDGQQSYKIAFGDGYSAFDEKDAFAYELSSVGGHTNIDEATLDGNRFSLNQKAKENLANSLTSTEQRVAWEQRNHTLNPFTNEVVSVEANLNDPEPLDVNGSDMVLGVGVRKLTEYHNDKLKDVDLNNLSYYLRVSGKEDEFQNLSEVGQLDKVNTEGNAVKLLSDYTAWKNDLEMRDASILKSRADQFEMKANDVGLTEDEHNQYQTIVSNVNAHITNINNNNKILAENVVPMFTKYAEEQKEKKKAVSDYWEMKRRFNSGEWTANDVVKAVGYTAKNVVNNVRNTTYDVIANTGQLAYDVLKYADVNYHSLDDQGKAELNQKVSDWTSFVMNRQEEMFNIVTKDLEMFVPIEHYKYNGENISLKDGLFFDKEGKQIKVKNLEQLEKIGEDKDFDALGIVPEAATQLTLMGGTVLTGTYLPYLAYGYSDTKAEFKDLFPDASEAEMTLFALTTNSVDALTEKISPDSKMLGVGSVKNYLIDALKGATKETRLTAMKSAGKEFLDNFVMEQIEESTALFGGALVNLGWNLQQGDNKLQQTIDSGELQETMIATAAMAPILSAGGSISAYRQTRSTASQNELLLSAIRNEGALKQIQNWLSDAELTRHIPAEKVAEFKVKLNDALTYKDKIPSNYSYEEFEKAKNLLKEKETLTERKKNLDPAFHDEVNSEIEAIDEQLKSIRGNNENSTPKETPEEASDVEKVEEFQNEEVEEKPAEAETIETFVDTDGKIKPVPEKEVKQEEKIEDPSIEQNTEEVQKEEVEKEQPSIEDEVVSEIVQKETSDFDSKIQKEQQKLEEIKSQFGEDSREAKAQQTKLNILNKAQENETPTSVTLDENNKPVYSGKGKNDQAEQRAALREAVKNGLYDNIPETEVNLQEGMTEEDVDNEISRTLSERGENPKQIVEHIERLQNKADENRNDTEGSKLEQIWNALKGGISLKSFQQFGDRNNLPRSVMATYGVSSKNDNNNLTHLDVIAEQLGVSEADLMDFMLRFPNKQAFEQALEIERDTPEIGGLKARFEEITGMKATPQNMEVFSSSTTAQPTEATALPTDLSEQPTNLNSLPPVNEPQQGEQEAFEQTAQEREKDLETYQKEIYGETVIQEKEENVQEAKTQSKETKEVKETDETLNKSELQDVGEKIGGARKDLAQSLKKVSDDDLSDKPLSQIFPRPDFNQLVKDGILTKEAATLLSYLYDNLPAKPRLKHRKKAWVGKVRTLIDTMELLLNDENQESSARTVSESLASYDMVFASYAKTIEALGEITDLKGYSVRESTDGRIYISKESFIVADGFKSFDEAAQRLKEILSKPTPKRKGTTFGVWSNRVTGEVFIGKKAGRNINKVMSGFKTVEDARKYLKENQAELDEIWDKMKTIADERRSENSPRVGPDYRKGKNVSSKDFKDTFGFRGVEFGNWVNTKERQAHINEAYDALMDLAHALDIDPRALSLNGQLAFAFGARGKGKANAHYETDKVVINLTKTKGAGSLAHEWWHALDNYFSRMRGKDMDYLTERPRRLIDQEKSRESGEQVMDDSVRVETILAIKGIVEAIEKSGLARRSDNLDKTRSNPYWGTMVEMTARAFENYIIQKLSENNHSNDYLANLQDLEGWVKAGMETDSFPYPNQEESQSINEAIQHLFDIIQQKETEDGNVALFQRGTNTFKAISKKAFKGLVGRLNRALGGKNKIITSEKEFRNALKKLGLTEAEIQQMSVRFDRSGNPIGDGSWNIEPTVFSFEEFPQVESSISLSETTESSYVKYSNKENERSITVRFSHHENNAVKFGDQLDGYFATKDEILAHLGLKKRVFIPETSKSIGAYQVKKANVSQYEVVDKTIQEIYELPIGADLSPYKGKVAKNSNWVIGGDVVIEVPVKRQNAIGQSVQVGKYEYQDIQLMQDSNGTIFGAVLPDGTIYLNENHLNANTPFHEVVGHVFLNNIKKNNPKAYKEIISKLQAEKSLMDEVKNDPAYSHLKTDEQIADELFARMIGDKGEQLFNELQNKSLAEKIRALVDKFWQNIKKWIGTEPQFKNIKNWTPEQFKSATISDIIDNLTKDALEGKQIITDQAEFDKNDYNRFHKSGNSESLFSSEEGKSIAQLMAGKPIPFKTAKEMISIMKDVAEFTNKSTTIFNAGIDYLKTTEWYENLSTEDKAKVESPVFRNAVGQMIREIGKADKKMEELKSKIKDNKQSKKDAVKTITDFISSSELPKKYITETELKRLMRRAAEVTTFEDMDKAIDKFVQTYEKVMMNAKSREITSGVTLSVREQVDNMLNSGMSEGAIIDSFDSKKDKDIARDQINRSKPSTKKEAIDKWRKTEKEYDEKLKFKVPNSKAIKRGLAKLFTDRQFTIKNLLDKSGLRRSGNLIINAQGASGFAERIFKNAYDNIWGVKWSQKPLNRNERKDLDNIIFLRRIVQIDKAREAAGLPPIMHSGGITGADAQINLDNIKDQLGSKQWNKLNDRADIYFKTFKRILKNKYEAGFLTKEAYNAMKDLDYSPRQLLGIMLDFNGDAKEASETRKKLLSDNGIKSFDEGSMEAFIKNAEYLLQNAISSAYKNIARNKVANMIFRELEKSKIRFEKLDAKIKAGEKLTHKDREFHESYKELSEKMFENPVIGTKKDGSPKYKYKEAPHNFTETFRWVDGQRTTFFVEDNLYEELVGESKPFIQGKARDIIPWITGSAEIKYFATGNNPAFFIANSPRDATFNYINSERYSAIPLIGQGQSAVESSKALINIAKSELNLGESLVDKLFEYGLSMEWLSTQGRLKKTPFDLMPANVRDMLKKAWGTATAQKLQTANELMFRVAIAQKSVSKFLQKHNLKGVNEITDSVAQASGYVDKQDMLDDMYETAVREARSILDFSRGGRITKDLELFIPYTNVAAQSLDKVVEMWKKKPLETFSKTIQVLGATSIATMTTSLMIISMMRADDDEEDKDKSSAEIYLDTINGLSVYERTNYSHIPLGMKDENGNYMSLRIAKEHALTPMLVVSDYYTQNYLRRKYGKREENLSMLKDRLSFAFRNNLTTVSGTTDLMPPTITAIATYASGYDFFREQQLQGTDATSKFRTIPKKAEGIKSPYVENFWKSFGEEYNMSPVRTKAAFESIFTSPSTSPLIGMMYGGADVAWSKDKTMMDVKDDASKSLKKAFTGRLIKSSSDYNRGYAERMRLKKLEEDVRFQAEKRDAIEKELIQKRMKNEISKEDFKKEADILRPGQGYKLELKYKERVSNKSLSEDIINIKFSETVDERVEKVYYYYGDVFTEDNKEALRKLIKAKEIITPSFIIAFKKKTKELNEQTD